MPTPTLCPKCHTPLRFGRLYLACIWGCYQRRLTETDRRRLAAHATGKGSK